MNQITCIFIFVLSVLFGSEDVSRVHHMVVLYDGKTIVCDMDSISEYDVYFTPMGALTKDSLQLKDIYYIYNDFDRLYHYSWSFGENINKMKGRTGHVYTVMGDTIPFSNIEFNNEMIRPDMFITTDAGDSKFISLLNIEKIVTDKSIMHYSIERGFFYSFFAFLLGAFIDSQIKKDDSGESQLWNEFNDLLPKASIVGLNENGPTFQSVSYLIPTSVSSSMVYDLWTKKNEFYFTPVYEERKFGRNMYVFSIKHIMFTYTKSLIRKWKKHN